MQIVVPAELREKETRVALHPESVKKLASLKNIEVLIESGAGDHLGLTDKMYKDAGASIVKDKKQLLSKADVVLKVNKPTAGDLAEIKAGTVVISFLDPFNEKTLIKKLATKKITAVSMEMIPRTTKAQKMDALSSQASLAGYAAVIQAASEIKKAFPMMMTPAGTISPVKVFVIGAGVAGLQAIATAKRLGARVEAYDTRAVVKEQVESLGGKFVMIDLGETGQTKNGYAKELTTEQLAKQQELMLKHCTESDIVITTAKLFGRKAPLLIPAKSVKQMKQGSVLVDLAADSGGNIEGSVPDKIVDINGVKIIGTANFPGRTAVHSSQMYGNNLAGFIKEFYDEESGTLILSDEDEITKSCVITKAGEIVNETISNFYKGEKK